MVYLPRHEAYNFYGTCNLNVGKYTIHGWYGYGWWLWFMIYPPGSDHMSDLGKRKIILKAGLYIVVMINYYYCHYEYCDSFFFFFARSIGKKVGIVHVWESYNFWMPQENDGHNMFFFMESCLIMIGSSGHPWRPTIESSRCERGMFISWCWLHQISLR